MMQTEQKLLHIVYDIDDVLADFWGTTLPIMNKVLKTDLTKEQFLCYNGFTDTIGITHKEFLQFIIDYVPMDSLQVNESIRKFLDYQYSMGHKIDIITSRDYMPDARDLTEYWLSKNDIPYHDLHISGKTPKHEFLESPVDIVYDDHHGNIEGYIHNQKLREDGIGVIVDQPWNRHYSRENVFRFNL